MDIIQRNFLRLLRCGAFGQKEEIEPMSAWKWSRLYQLPLMHGVTALVYDGISRLTDDFFLQIPEAQKEQWRRTVAEIEDRNRQLNQQTAALINTLQREHLHPILLKGQALAAIYPTPLHRTSGNIDLCFSTEEELEKANQWAMTNGENVDDAEKYALQYEWNEVSITHHQSPQRLTNPLLNRKLQQIIRETLNDGRANQIAIGQANVGLPPATLNLLLVIIRITRYILTEGISMKQLTDLGILLRHPHPQVDYGQLQQWLKELRMERIAQLEGVLLVQLLGFQADELHITTEKSEKNIEAIIDEVFKLTSHRADEWYFTLGKNIFVQNSNSTAMMWHIRHSARLFGYYPSETLTNFFASFAHSLSHIEE